jgi:putative FmdB family regulatory protein
MPIYNYKCPFCKKEYESFEKMGTKNIICTCGKQANKVPSLSSFHLKGGGWAKDGYSNKK